MPDAKWHEHGSAWKREKARALPSPPPTLVQGASGPLLVPGMGLRDAARIKAIPAPVGEGEKVIRAEDHASRLLCKWRWVRCCVQGKELPGQVGLSRPRGTWVGWHGREGGEGRGWVGEEGLANDARSHALSSVGGCQASHPPRIRMSRPAHPGGGVTMSGSSV